MRKLTKRISLAAASAAVAGGAVLGAGGTASAAVPVSAPVQHSAVSIKADDYRREHGVTHRHHHKEACCRDDSYRDRQHDDCYTRSHRSDRHGHFYRWDDKDCGWKHDTNYRDDCNRYDHGGNRHEHDRGHDHR
ncbi:hypothetical protein [Streptomyces sp. NPDC052036]|uniref:hypothetical protein n=1 Tax=unclassified Streptomyces TaxID=2593676 RepID=UPI00343BACF5